MKSGPIIIIEDDVDDKDVLEEIIKEFNLNNKLVWFENCKDAWEYLITTHEQPFIIFCDINLPGQNGIEFKRQIDENKAMRKKSIPFIFYSTTANQKFVNEAYTEMTVQGFFQKSDSFEGMKKDIKIILDYWKACIHPNTK